jgi:hypothetical protein
MRLHQHHLKINLDKCLFSDQQVSYLGFTLTPQGIKPGENKLKAIRLATAPTDVKSICSFVGLCNFFQNHIQNFAITAAPLFKLTRQDSVYLSGPLPKPALQAFQALQTQLYQEPALAFPRSDQKYLLIMNAYTPTNDLPGGLCATLAQRNDQNKVQIISHASRQLKENEKNYTPFLLETAAAVWGMDNFKKYLKGVRFCLYMDPTTEPNLGNTQLKTLNRLKTAMSEHNFNTRNRQNAYLPPCLKQKQTDTQKDQHASNQNFNKTIHVDTFQEDYHQNQAIVTMTDESTAYSVSTIITLDNTDSLIEVLKTQWFDEHGFPKTICFKQGKVQVSKLERKLNEMAPLGTKVTCKSWTTTFNTETEQQWKQNQQLLTGEDFVNMMNFFHNVRKPEFWRR